MRNSIKARRGAQSAAAARACAPVLVRAEWLVPKARTVSATRTRLSVSRIKQLAAYARNDLKRVPASTEQFTACAREYDASQTL